MHINNKTELLAPSGTMDSVTAAVNGGCDAIYIGGKAFSARAYASNFSDEDLNNIIDYCHLRDVKVFVTLNILYKDTELNDVLSFVSTLYQHGVDAFILQDIGLFNVIKKHFKNVRLHASTQLTTHNLNAVLALEKMGFDRVVLSRELSISEIKNIKDKSNVELESFIHGALCVSYSGRCLMSSIIGERSGNRGRCAQPCRLQYKLMQSNNIIKSDYLLSPKDISTLPIINRIIKSGVTSLKIEGRMKSPEYVSQVVSTYRKYIDTNSSISKTDNKNITQIFNRGGSSSQGYFDNWSGIDMISASPKSSGIKIGEVTAYNSKNKKCTIQLSESVVPGDGIEIWTKNPEHAGTNISRPAASGETITLIISGFISKGDSVYKSYDKILADTLAKTYLSDTRVQTIYAEVIAHINKEFLLSLTTDSGISISVTGEPISRAENQPTSRERILSQLSKTGNTPFNIEFTNTQIDDDIYISISSLNNTRRDAIDKLTSAIIKSYKREKVHATYTPPVTLKTDCPKISVSVLTKEQFDIAVLSDVNRIYIELNADTFNDINYYINMTNQNSKELFLALPRVYRYNKKDTYSDYILELEDKDFDGYLLRNYDNIKTKKSISYDYTFNVFNSATLETLSSMPSSETITLSPELNLDELRKLSGANTEVYVYGRLELMTTHQCPVGLYVGNKKNEKFCSQKDKNNTYYIRDRKNMDFPIVTQCESCVALILNSSPIFLLNKSRDMLSIGSRYYRLSLTTESGEISSDIIYAYHQVLNSLDTDDRINNLLLNLKKTTTNGHFYRGVL